MDAAQILEQLHELAGRTQTELDKLNDAIGCSAQMGPYLIQQARKAGFDIPNRKPTKKAPTVTHTIRPTAPTTPTPWRPGDAARRYGQIEGDDHDDD